MSAPSNPSKAIPAGTWSNPLFEEANGDLNYFGHGFCASSRPSLIPFVSLQDVVKSLNLKFGADQKIAVDNSPGRRVGRTKFRASRTADNPLATTFYSVPAPARIPAHVPEHDGRKQPAGSSESSSRASTSHVQRRPSNQHSPSTAPSRSITESPPPAVPSPPPARASQAIVPSPSSPSSPFIDNPVHVNSPRCNRNSPAGSVAPAPRHRGRSLQLTHSPATAPLPAADEQAEVWSRAHAAGVWHGQTLATLQQLSTHWYSLKGDLKELRPSPSQSPAESPRGRTASRESDSSRLTSALYASLRLRDGGPQREHAALQRSRSAASWTPPSRGKGTTGANASRPTRRDPKTQPFELSAHTPDSSSLTESRSPRVRKENSSPDFNRLHVQRPRHGEDGAPAHLWVSLDESNPGNVFHPPRGHARTIASPASRGPHSSQLNAGQSRVGAVGLGGKPVRRSLLPFGETKGNCTHSAEHGHREGLRSASSCSSMRVRVGAAGALQKDPHAAPCVQSTRGGLRQGATRPRAVSYGPQHSAALAPQRRAVCRTMSANPRERTGFSDVDSNRHTMPCARKATRKPTRSAWR